MIDTGKQQKASVEKRQKWTEIRKLIESSLTTVGVDVDVWQSIQETVNEYVSTKESAGPVFDTFYDKFLREGLSEPVAKKMAEIMNEPYYDPR